MVVRYILAVAFSLWSAQVVAEEDTSMCDQFNINSKASSPIHEVTLPPSQPCSPILNNGIPMPDPKCTPGAINPTVTTAVLQDPNFRTRCVRNMVTTEQEKMVVYRWYVIRHPINNSGKLQTCELDHVIPLELGGADTLDNIWPQCGPPGVSLDERYFKIKDKVETYLARQVKEGLMDLGEAQRGIAADWTQYINAAIMQP